MYASQQQKLSSKKKAPLSIDGTIVGPIQETKGQNTSPEQAVQNIWLPPLDSHKPNLLAPSFEGIELATAQSPYDVVQMLATSSKMALLVKAEYTQTELEKQANTLLDRANSQWNAIQEVLPVLKEIESCTFYRIPKQKVIAIFYQTNPILPATLLSLNLQAFWKALGFQSGPIHHIDSNPPQFDVDDELEVENSTNEDLQYVLDEINANSSDEPLKTKSPPQTNGSIHTVYVQLYYPDIKQGSIITEFAQYKNRQKVTLFVRTALRKVLEQYFAPHNKYIRIDSRRSEIIAKINNVPSNWIEANTNREHLLFEMIRNLHKYYSLPHVSIVPYNGKLAIGLKPVDLSQTGQIEARDILHTHNGNVYLDDPNRSDHRLNILPAPRPLPLQVDQSAFQKSRQFQVAKQQRNNFALLTDVVPARIVHVHESYASLRDFAMRAPTRVWNELWDFVEQVRQEYKEKTLYFSTSPIPQHAYFNIVVTDRAGYPQSIIREWKQRAHDAIVEKKIVKDQETQLFSKEKLSPSYILPAIELSSEKEDPIVQPKLKSAKSYALVYLVLLHESLPGSLQVMLMRRQSVMDSFWTLPVAKVATDSIGSSMIVPSMLKELVQLQAPTLLQFNGLP